MISRAVCYPKPHATGRNDQKAMFEEKFPLHHLCCCDMPNHLFKIFTVHSVGYSRQRESDVSVYKIFVNCLELRLNCRREIERNVKTGGDYACKLPELPVNAPEIMRFIKSVPDIDCSKAGIDWVACQVEMF